VLTWILGYVGAKSLNWLFDKAAQENLAKRLRKSVRDWSSSLPPAISVSPDTLFPETIDAAMKNDPAIVQISARLSQNRLPSTEQWAAVIEARRRFVKASAPAQQLQAFYVATDDQVRAAILQLAECIDRECRQDTKLFKGEALAKLEELARSVQEIRESQPARPLQWTEQHVLMTLGVGLDSSSAEQEEAKRSKQRNFNECLLDLLAGSESVAMLLAKHAQALGLSTSSALDLWNHDSLQLPSDLNMARAPVAVVGWRFETTDPRISFSIPDAELIDERHYTADLVSFFHGIFPETPVIVACMETAGGLSNSTFSEFDVFVALERVIEQLTADILVIPFGMSRGRDHTAYATMAQLGFIPILSLSFAHGGTAESARDRLAVLSSPVLAQQARQQGEEALCFPMAQFRREKDGSGDVVSNDGLGCMVAAGMASLLISSTPERTGIEIIKAIQDSRRDSAYPMPSYEKAAQLLA
jgi:hypothetical protein